jgi:hypothetical protein
MIVSGLILYIAPPGRIAKWTYIPILGLEKDQWQALHIIFTFLFIVANGFHLYFNWNSFLSYLKDKKKQVFRLRRELISAFLIAIGILYLVLINVQPFKGVIDFGEAMKSDWSSNSSEPPVPHAEEMTISELAKTIIEDPDLLVSRLEKQGISADINSVVKEIARKYELPPQRIFEKLQFEGNSKTDHQGVKRGYGRMTVIQICNEKNIPLEDAIMKLNNHGIDAQGESILRELAQKSNNSPIEIVKIIEDIGKN